MAGLAAAAVWQGPLAAGREWLLAWGGARGTVLPQPLPVLGLLLAAFVAAVCLADAKFRASPRELIAGLMIGILVALGWLLIEAGDPHVNGLNFPVPLALTIAYLASLPIVVHASAVLLVVGTVIGAWLAAAFGGQVRIEAFSSREDMVRHLVGGLLMGSGGALAAGCTIGHGIGGLAMLAPGSLVAAAAMLLGARWSLHHLETGYLIRRSGGTHPAMSPSHVDHNHNNSLA
jgi:hypothetical protein